MGMTTTQAGRRDRRGREIAVGDTVSVPHEGDKVISGFSTKESDSDCFEDYEIPIAIFEDGRLPNGCVTHTWEYVDSLTLVRKGA